MADIILGNLKFYWAGNWQGTFAYEKDDVVKYGPNAYVCITAHTSQATFAPDSAKWELMVAGIENAGAWSNSTLYKYGEVVSYGGAVYVALRENTGVNPVTGTSDWQVVSEGQQWEGGYDNATTYQKGDIVVFGGYTYIATTNTTGNLPTNTSYWDIHTKGFAFLGNYDNADTYYPGQIVKYGGRLYINVQTSVGNDPSYVAYWTLIQDGMTWASAWVTATDYKIGDIVRYGGRSYICISGHNSSVAYPYNPTYWELVNDGLAWQGSYSAGTTYQIGDVVEYAQSSYVSIVSANVGNTPSSSPASWNLVAQGDSNAVITTRGDILTRDATQAVRLPIGPAGSFLTSDGTDLKWGHLTPQNDYFVSPQGDDTNDGRTPTTSWKTIKHAATQTFSLGQCRINISSGTYTEQCPIRIGRGVVVEGNGLGAVTVSPDTTNDNGFGVGISDDGSTPNANSNVFLMNNGSRLRNFVFRNFSTGSVIVSLDPGYGPDDTSVWITSQSPYVQNCTSFTPGGTGFKIDGALHNGGYKSMVANDWTQINSDGIGIHALNDGRTEIVSCFTYYCDIGYLAESGGKIRAIVGNNSYGEYGAVARGFSQAETPLGGTLQLDDKTLNSIEQVSSNAHLFTSYRDSVGNRVFVGHTAPTGTNVTSTFDNTASYPFIVKYNSAGSADWIYTYEGDFGAIHSVVEVSDRYFAGGVIYNGGTNKGFILAISKAGEIQWQKTIGNTSEINDITTDGDNIYAVGTHTTSGMTAIKLNVAGIEQWSRTLNYNDSTAVNTIVPTSCTFAGTPTSSTATYASAGDATAENNLYIAAYDSTVNESTVTRITSAGVFITTYTYGDVRINKLRLDTGNGDGIYLMAAGYYDAGAVNKNPLAFRIRVNGDIAWQKQLSVGSEEGEWSDVLPFGNDIYLVGYMNEGTNNNNTGLVARYTSTGSPTWIRKFDNGTNNIALNGVLLDGVNVIAGGIEQGNSVVLNIQRDLNNGIGTVTSGSYVLGAAGETETNNTVVTKSINAIDQTSVTLGVTDTTLTLNQSPGKIRTIVATRAGFAGIGTGVLFTVDGLTREPKEGSVLTITGDSETYFVIGVNSYDDVAESAQIQINPAIPSNKTPNDGTAVVFREAYSQVRMSGHDFLDIGTGGFADTNYPVIISSDYTQQPNQDRETLAENGGRVFYVTTDQDGNFRVGDYFKVEQATGRATLSSEEFDLAGLNELQLGSITAGKQGATINEFSTDGTMADNSDSAVPTEKAVVTYIATQLANGSASAVLLTDTNDNTQVKVDTAGDGTDDTIVFDTSGNTRLTITASGQINAASTYTPSTNYDLTTKTYVDTALAGLSQNSVSQGNSDLTVTDAGTGSIVATLDGGAIATFTAAGTTISNAVSITDTTASTTADTGALKVDGGIGLNGDLFVGGTINELSSIAYKQNINPITNALETISQLSGVIYDRKDGSTINEPGLIAEEVAKVLPNIIGFKEDGSPEAIKYTKIIAYLIEAVKDLKDEIRNLKG